MALLGIKRTFCVKKIYYQVCLEIFESFFLLLYQLSDICIYFSPFLSYIRPIKKNCSFPIAQPSLFFCAYPNIFIGNLHENTATMCVKAIKSLKWSNLWKMPQKLRVKKILKIKKITYLPTLFLVGMLSETNNFFF